MGTLGFSITAPLLPDLADEFMVSRGSIGLVQAAVSVPGVIFSGVIGYLADRLGRRRVMITSLLLFSTFGLAGFVARSFWSLIAVRFVQGIGTSGILGLGIVLVGDLFVGDERKRAIGYNLVGLTVVNMIGPSLSGLLATWGTFLPFLVFGVGFPLALWTSRLAPDAPKEKAAAPTRHISDAVTTMRAQGTLIDFVGILIATLAAVVVLHGLGLTTTPLFLDEEFGTSVGIRGLVLAFFQVGVIITAIRITRITGAIGVTTAITAGFGLMSLGTLIVALAPDVWVVTVGLGVAGVGFGLFTPLAQEYGTRAAGAAYRGVTVLTWVTIVRVGQVIGPPAGSFFADGAGARFTFAVATVGMALMALVWRPLRSRAHRRPVHPPRPA